MNERVDRLGAVASTLCAVHCGLCALLPVALSALGLGFLLGERAEWLFTAVAVLFATGAIVLGWRQHRSVSVVALLATGVIGLMASRGLEMGGEHHHHHGEHHAEHHNERTEHAEHHNEHGEHEERTEHGEDVGAAKMASASDGHGVDMHLAGSFVGVLGGLLLFIGHLQNIRATRRARVTCCAP